MEWVNHGPTKCQTKWLITSNTKGNIHVRVLLIWEFGPLNQRNHTTVVCHNECNGISNHRCLDLLLHCLFRCTLQKISRLCMTGLWEGNSPVTNEFPAQRASNVENVFIWWCLHEMVAHVLIFLQVISWLVVTHYVNMVDVDSQGPVSI